MSLFILFKNPNAFISSSVTPMLLFFSISVGEAAEHCIDVGFDACTNKVYILIAMQVSLDKSICRMHECKYACSSFSEQLLDSHGHSQQVFG